MELPSLFLCSLIRMEPMDILKNKLFWTVIVTAVFIYSVVNANKEQSKTLLDQYYEVEADTIKQQVIIEEPAKRDSLVLFAKNLLGKSYVYGSSGPDRFDCSGYIYYVFKNFNIKLPRSSRFQSKEGDVIAKEEIKIGDLLFFKSPSPDNPNIGHVGIAIENEDGNIKFIHSSTGRGVVIDSLASKHYGRRFMEARRVID